MRLLPSLRLPYACLVITACALLALEATASASTDDDAANDDDELAFVRAGVRHFRCLSCGSLVALQARSTAQSPLLR